MTKTFDQLLAKPDTKKILLCELDIGQLWAFYVNWRTGCWKVNFDGVYSEITVFTSDIPTLTITRIGSMKVDGVSLLKVNTKEDVQTNDSSFFFDDLFNTIYLHCLNGDEPSIHQISIGEAYGFANYAGVYNNFIYDGRLLSIPSISTSKDPQFFGVISFEGGEVVINNDDGAYDKFGEDNDVFGNSGRVLMGFKDLSYSEFIPIVSGFIENMKITESELRVMIQDKRKQLSRNLPVNVFDDTTYPNIKDKNVGKPIPIGYGIIKNAPVICTNEVEGGAPANYDFKLCDTTYHSIKEITEVRVEGVAKGTSAQDLDAGTFSLATADYDPGDEVTCDFQGYVDALGNLIENGLDVTRDLLECYYGIKFNSNFFNTSQWHRNRAPNINYFLNKEKKLVEIIGEIAETVQGDFIVDDDERFSFRLYDPVEAASYTIPKEWLLEIPEIEYDSSEVLTSLIVGYAKDWAEDEYLLYEEKSQEEDIFNRFKTYLRKTFNTLLTSKVDAQTWAEKRMRFSGDVKKVFPVLTKPQIIQREIDDLIYVYVNRKNKEMLGKCKAQIIGIEKDGNGMTVRLDCRLIEILSETYIENHAYYGDTYYGDNYYGITELRSA